MLPAGAGLEQVRVRFSSPPPQFTLHRPNVDQFDHWPSTAGTAAATSNIHKYFTGCQVFNEGTYFEWCFVARLSKILTKFKLEVNTPTFNSIHAKFEPSIT